MAPEGPNFPGNNVVSIEAARAERDRRNAELAESPEAGAVREAELYFVDKWERQPEIRKFVEELQTDQDKSENRAVVYGLMAVGGLAAAMYGLPEVALNDLTSLVNSNFADLAEMTARVAVGPAALVVGVLKTLEQFREYFRIGTQIQEIEQSPSGQAALA